MSGYATPAHLPGQSQFQQAFARIYAQHYGQGNINPGGFSRWLRTMSVHPEMQNVSGQRMISAASQGIPLSGLGGLQ